MKNYKEFISILLPILVSGMLSVSGCTSTNTVLPPAGTDTVIDSAATSPPPVATDSLADPTSDWFIHADSVSGVSFQFPSTWFGPDVYLSDDDVRLEIGSDIVYPYGTSREDQIYTLPDSYYILIQYRPNINHLTIEDYSAESSWISPALYMFNLADGESRSDARSLEIKVRDLEVGRFKGVEYIATLSDTAQTERAYSRQMFLLDEQLNILMISASPNNVEVADPANWKIDFQRVDEANLEILYKVIDSIVIE